MRRFINWIADLIDDYLNAVKLIDALLQKIDSKKYEELLKV